MTSSNSSNSRRYARTQHTKGKATAKKATGAPFNPLHTSMYDLKVMERCPDTQRVISVRCQFCIKSGIEVDPVKPRQRAPRKGNMAWTESFRTDKYTDHHERQHPIEWARYKAFSFDEKAKFFACMTPHANTMLPHINVGLAAAPLELRVLSPIVDVDRKSTRLNSSHTVISYAVFCLKKKS